MNGESKVTVSPPGNKTQTGTQGQIRRDDPPEEALAHWEDEGGHLVENGNGKN